MRIGEVIGHIRNAAHITFILGAGASRSAGIPTAVGLVEIIEREFSHCISGLSAEDRKSYGKVMATLSPADRKRLIEPLLENAKLNWGHVALARIIRATQVRRILSFNFDFLMERATALMGEHLPVYDFGVSPSRHVTGLADKAIFHLHGQSYGMTLLNTENETREHAEKLRPVLSDSLRNHLTIVVGYSGEADAAFDVMAEAFDSNNNLIWLGHDPDPKPHLKELLSKQYAHYIGGCDFDLTLIEIARGLGCWPIPLIANPPGHALSLLDFLPTFPVEVELTTEVLEDTRSRLRAMSESWAGQRTTAERIAEGLISGRSGDQSVDPSSLGPLARTLAAYASFANGNKFAEEARDSAGEERAQKLALAGEAYSNAIDVKPDMHQALNNWGNVLSYEAMDLLGEARTKKFELAGEKYAAALAIKPDKEEALFNWGLAISQEAQSLYGDARGRKFAEAADKYAASLSIKPDYYAALHNWGALMLLEAKDLQGPARALKITMAQEKFAETLAIKPEMHESFVLWGNSLLEQAEGLDSSARAEKLAAAREKYSSALEIKPDDHEILNCIGTALLLESRSLLGKAKAKKLLEAEEVQKRVRKLSGKGSYNLACVFALSDRISEALDELEVAQKDGAFPDLAHIISDDDMTPLRSEPRFQAILARAESRG